MVLMLQVTVDSRAALKARELGEGDPKKEDPEESHRLSQELAMVRAELEKERSQKLPALSQIPSVPISPERPEIKSKSSLFGRNK